MATSLSKVAGRQSGGRGCIWFALTFLVAGIIWAAGMVLMIREIIRSEQPWSTLESTLMFIGPGIFILLGLGGLVLIWSGGRDAKKQAAQQAYLRANGLAAEAQVTFVDRNYSVRINGRPVFSVVECAYSDGSGGQQILREDYLPTEEVIRSGLRVGDTIRVLYLPEDPTQRMIADLMPVRRA